MKDEILNQKLDSHIPPLMSSNLQARILEAGTAPVVSAPISAPFAKRFMPIAASLLAICLVGYTVYQPSQNTQTETEIWQEAALDLGFDEIYNWVESEDSLAQ